MADPTPPAPVEPVSEKKIEEGEAWLKKNRAALEAYNEHVEKHGAFSDGLRSF